MRGDVRLKAIGEFTTSSPQIDYDLLLQNSSL
jgi:hypothetical protein